MKKPIRCAGFDEQGKAFNCPNTPGTKYGPMWCAECDARRMTSLNRQMQTLKASLGGDV